MTQLMLSALALGTNAIQETIQCRYELEIEMGKTDASTGKKANHVYEYGTCCALPLRPQPPPLEPASRP